jgi:rod shape-determining protein MreC
MRNLFILLWKNNFFILFLLIESFCAFLIVQNNNFQHASFINSTNEVAAHIHSVVSEITDYINLRASNEALARENAGLRSFMPDIFYVDSVQKKITNDSVYKQQYTFMPAKVINNSTNRRNNYLTLDKGSAQGVKPEMGVISSKGIVGIVKDVSEHFCSVISILHKDSRISTKIKKSSYIGSLVWEGYKSDYATLNDIPKHVILAKGDTLITSSFSAIFPEGILIGTIADFEPRAGDNFYSIDVKLSTDFNNLNYVYIVNNIFKEEQKKLEETQAHDH